jgi:hypothetical protein
MGAFQWGEVRIEDAALAGGFVQVPAAVLFDPELSSGAKVTYGALLWYAWKYHGCPEQRVMAQELGVSLRTIQAHTAELERTGYIEATQLGLGRPNAYVIKTLQNRPERPHEAEYAEPQKTAGLGRRQSADPQKTAGLGRNMLRVKDAEHCASPSLVSLDSTTTQQQVPSPEAAVVPNKPSAVGNTVVVAASETHPALDDILARLLALGVTRSTAKAILRHHDAEVVYRWLAYTEQKLATGWVPQESPAAWLVTAIRSGDWVIPSWFQTPEEEGAAATQAQHTNARERTLREKAAELESREAAEQRRRMEGELGVGERTREHWERVKLLMGEWGEFSPVFYSAFLLPLNGATATITTPVQFYCQQIERHSDALKRAIQDVCGKPIEALEVRHFEPGPAAAE